MRTIYTCAALLLFAVFQIYALDPIQFEVISRFPNGRGEGEFRFHEFEGMGSNPSSPKGLSFVDGVFYITDNVNQRVIRLEENGNHWGVLLNNLDPGFNLIRQGRFLFDFASSGFYNVYNHDQQSLTVKNSRLSTGDASYYMKTVIAGDMILVNTSPERGTETPRYFGFHITEDFDGTISMMNPEETI
ncbi:hypothetical protein, partial [Spirochaeta lutea]|uniref:hypothetical protein n=1 Tax=Spirochaeta lutea TaxID=1480694 RepID=UPI00055EA5BE